MEIRINNEPIPEGKTVKKIRLSEAIQIFRDKPIIRNKVITKISKNTYFDTHLGEEVKVGEFTHQIFEDVLLQEYETLQNKKSEYRIQKKCRDCERSFSVIKGCRREHARLCQNCTDLRKYVR